MEQLNNHLTEEEVAQCADAINSGSYHELPDGMRVHLAHCDQCSAEILMVADISFDFNASHKKARTVQLKPWHIAATAMVAAGVLTLVVLNLFNISYVETTEGLIAQQDTIRREGENNRIILNDNFKEDKEEIATLDPTPKKQEPENKEIDNGLATEPTEVPETDRTELLAAYTPDPTLETLYNNYTQAYRGETITVTTNNVVYLSGTDSLTWTNPRSRPLTVEFFNNKGNLIQSHTKESSGIPIPTFDNGLYYWKLISEDFDLLFVGKILVE